MIHIVIVIGERRKLTFKGSKLQKGHIVNQWVNHSASFNKLTPFQYLYQVLNFLNFYIGFISETLVDYNVYGYNKLGERYLWILMPWMLLLLKTSPASLFSELEMVEVSVLCRGDPPPKCGIIQIGMNVARSGPEERRGLCPIPSWWHWGTSWLPKLFTFIVS